MHSYLITAPGGTMTQDRDEFERWQDYDGIERYRCAAGYTDNEFQRNWTIWQASRAALAARPVEQEARTEP
jgi:hypothetical protein